MDARRFWQQKLVQFFHDPPAKPYARWPGTGGHKKVARDLFERFTGLPFEWYATHPDIAAAGADRPLVDPSREKGVSPISFTWWSEPILTHPLAAGFLLDTRRHGEDVPDAQAVTKGQVIEEEIMELDGLAPPPDSWGSTEELRASYLRLWRKYRDALVFRDEAGRDKALSGDLLWAEMPSDSRCPDHSIWDHLRVTTALAFLNCKVDAYDHPQCPWLLRISIGPVQSFLAEARTTRDLWIGSFLLADLAWHAMKPFVARYGPDCVLYPDLRGNPRADVWLFDDARDALPNHAQNPNTFAAVLPNAFVALVPRGGAEHLVALEELAREAQREVRNRWGKLAAAVGDWLGRVAKDEDANRWQGTWTRQHEEPPVYCIWSAVPWLKPDRIENPDSLRGRALPAQRRGFREAEAGSTVASDRRAIDARVKRLAPWVPPDAWAQYELAREVFARTNLYLHQLERGFDYAVTHHQLNTRQVLRKATSPRPRETGPQGEAGEKCTLCGKRTALGGELTEPQFASTRARAQRFWSQEALDPDKQGHERLCAVCTMRRFLVEAGRDPETRKLTGLNPIWAGPATPLDEVLDRDAGKVRVPFPSSATLAAQGYLSAIATDSGLARELLELVAAHQAAGLPATTFPRSLPALAAAHRRASSTGQAFLEREAQEVLFPEAIEGQWRYWKPRDEQRAGQFHQLLQAARRLRKVARARGHGDPSTRIAVVVLDGDHMHRLLLGEAESIAARWRDVLHPRVVERISEHPQLLAAGWLDLLETKRLMGPSLHAFISRALGQFSHRIVPWVVEQEFSGRLIYAGGDDVLCLAPAEDALPLAARLQQLYSAAWVVDTNHRADAWEWRRRAWTGTYEPERARSRFLVPARPRDGSPIRLPLRSAEEVETHASMVDHGAGFAAGEGPVLPMLGPGCSLSAGIAYGHYKTPLGPLITAARHMLDDYAKDRAGRRAVGLCHHSRNGVKSEIALKWSDQGPPQIQHRLRRIAAAFESGSLPNRLPYKLRVRMPLVSAALDRLEAGREAQAVRGCLLRGVLQEALDKAIAPELEDDLMAVWRAGVELHVPPYSPEVGSRERWRERAVDGLLLCRYLAAAEDGSEE